jgi:hypothetical protein
VKHSGQPVARFYLICRAPTERTETTPYILNATFDWSAAAVMYYLSTDAGVKLLHSPSGCIQCVYLTTPSMQLAFNAVPQFLCIETGK